MAEVSWTQREAAKLSAATGCLIRVLALRQQLARAPLVVAMHIPGDLNVLGGIPSRSFVYPKQWNCTNDSEFLSLINSKFPLPHQCYWQGFRLSFALSMKVISELGIKAYLMGEWKRLRRIGKSFVGHGVSIANPSELTHTWRKFISKPKQGLQQDLQAACENAAMATENRYKLEQCVQHKEVSMGILPWTQGNNPFTNLGQTTNASYRSNICSKGLKTKTHQKSRI